ncbi:MAG: helicase-exonuclease AddAB subunit AddA, partial [Peptococcaceae bacterium]|nr:helicase-exonuclease AddAB subunit AddA [Peptococcaceae bacterium]
MKMSERWTREQLAAVNSRGRNLLVAAAAGAGKTAVLVERIIRRITDPAAPVDVDRLLVVTFTNAAASEMRERIGKAINRELERYPASKHLQRQIALLGGASISTMHSFCLDLLRQYFYLTDLDPAFRVADATEAALLQTEALEELFERRYADDTQQLFHRLVDAYGGARGDTLLQELVLKAHNLAYSTIDPAGWLGKLALNFPTPGDASSKGDCFDHLSWARVLKEAVAITLEGACADLEQALQVCRRPGGPGPYLENLAEDLQVITDILRDCAAGASWSSLHQAFNQVSFRKLAACRKDVADPILVQQVKQLRDGAKKKIAMLQKEYFSRTAEQFYEDLAEVAPLVGAMAELVSEFGATYRQKKATRGVVDFNDLEHYCLQILSQPGSNASLPSRAALEQRRRYEEVLVDEYQDINEVQEGILNLVSRQGEEAPNLFMVGDVKQSIYRFRLAEPGLFLSKYQNYPVWPGAREQRIDLSRNFRSRQGIVDAVNFVFRQLMTPCVGEMAYDAAAELVYGAGYPGQGTTPANEQDEAVELYLIEGSNAGGTTAAEPSEVGDMETEQELEEEKTSLQLEAGLVADRIRELVQGDAAGNPGMQIYDRATGAYRALTYRDVVVLLRATSGAANIFAEEFKLKGIPVYSELATGYFEATEVETVLSLLHVIDNPRKDVPLAAVLRSPIVGLTAADLARIRLASRRGDYYDAVVTASREGQDELAAKLVDFLARLEKWRTAARQGTLSDLIWLIYRDTGYYDFVGGLPGGSQRQANLRALHNRAQQYESTTFRGLFLFLRFIERIRQEGRDLGTARILSEKENVVRIMSIHKSKGLEFPVIFLAGLNRKFNLSDLTKDMLFHKELGVGSQLVDTALRVSYPTPAKLAIKYKLKMENLAEEMRILYVAMTRAREKLVLVGSTRNLEQSARKWCTQVGLGDGALSDSYLSEVKSPLEWLAAALARHREGALLRELGQCDEAPHPALANDRSCWKIFLNPNIKAEAAEKLDYPEILDRVKRLEPLAPGPQADLVKARLDWTYPLAQFLGRAAKVSVTELKRRFELIEEREAGFSLDRRLPVGGRPLFMQERHGLSAAEAGTALHLVMQHLNWQGGLDAASISAHIDKMVEMELLTEEQAAAVPAAKIAAFFASPLGARALRGGKLLRELPFTLALP